MIFIRQPPTRKLPVGDPISEFSDLLHPKETGEHPSSGSHVLWQAEPLKDRNQAQGNQSAERCLEQRLAPRSTAVDHSRQRDHEGQAGGVQLRIVRRQPRKQRSPGLRAFWHFHSLCPSQGSKTTKPAQWRAFVRRVGFPGGSGVKQLQLPFALDLDDLLFDDRCPDLPSTQGFASQAGNPSLLSVLRHQLVAHGVEVH